MTTARQCDDGRHGLLLGAMLVVLGLVFILARLGMYSLGDLEDWWPVFPIGFGLVRIGSWRSAGEVASGVSWALLGVWFLVATQEKMGLDWSNSWPLALVAIGASMLVRAALERTFERRPPSGVAGQGGGGHA